MKQYSGLAITAFCLFLSACDSGGDNPQTPDTDGFTLSGTITADSDTAVDIDVNDPSRQNKNNPKKEFQTNDSLIKAQTLPNPVVLNGFVSRIPTGTEADAVGNYTDTFDLLDYYKVELLEGEFVSLQVSDFDPDHPDVNDIDLELIDADDDKPEPTKYSNSVTEFESVAASADGEYYVRIKAYSGISKYVLKIGDESLRPGVEAFGSSMELVKGEAIVQLKASSAISAAAAASAPKLQLSHNDRSRPGLTKFALPNIASAAASDPLTAKLEDPYREQRATLDAIKELNRRPDVEYAEPNFYLHAQSHVPTPNDSLYLQQDNLTQIKLPEAWHFSTGVTTGNPVIVAVVDNGVALAHEDLAGQLVDGYDFVSDETTSMDGDGIDSNPNDPGQSIDGEISSIWHGTHVAGIIAASPDNDIGIAGVSWGAKIMPVRVLDVDGNGTSYDLAQGIRYATGLSNDSGTVPAQAADIINLSVARYPYNETLRELFDEIRNNTNTIVIASAGNDHSIYPSYPASFDNVVSVSAIDQNNNMTDYSNQGEFIDIAAPGGTPAQGILSTIMTSSEDGASFVSSYARMNGTSMAAPHVSGVAALMKAVHPGLTAEQFDASLKCGKLTTDLRDPGRDHLFGYGVIDALLAVNEAERLAAPGSSSVCATPLATPKQVDFGATASVNRKTLVLSRPDSNVPIIEGFSIAEGSTWLSVDDSNKDPDGYGRYVLTIDRAEAAEGNNSGKIVFSADNGYKLVINIKLEVTDQANTVQTRDTGFVYVELYNRFDNTVVATQGVDVRNGEYHFAFTGLPASEYYVRAGSDLDKNLTICGRGESCGVYPDFSEPSRLFVNGNISNIDFPISITPHGALAY